MKKKKNSTDPYFVKEFKVEFRDSRHGTLYVTTIEEPNKWQWAKDICFPEGISSSDLDELAKSILKKNGYIVNPNLKHTVEKETDISSQLRPVNDGIVNYDVAVDQTKVFLVNQKKAPAQKIILKPRKRQYNEIIVYVIKEKSSGKWISALDENGYRVSKDSPLFFTSEDIACIGNTEDFEIVKMTRKCKAIANKIAK